MAQHTNFVKILLDKKAYKLIRLFHEPLVIRMLKILSGLLVHENPLVDYSIFLQGNELSLLVLFLG